MATRELAIDLSGEVIVVTGGAGVLCSAMAEALAARGAAVAVLDIDEKAAEERVASIRLKGGRATAVRCSVLDRQDLEQAARTIETLKALSFQCSQNHPQHHNSQ